MSADKNDDIFDDDFDSFEGGGDDFPHDNPPSSSGGGGSNLLDLWNNNPLLKLAIIVGLVVIGVGSVYAFMGGSRDKEPPQSQLSGAPNQSEAPGGEVSQTYGDALDERNQQNLEAALGNRGVSAIPVPVNRGDNSLTLDTQETESTEDPLAIWQRENQTPPQQQIIPEPTIPPAPPAPVQVPQEQLQSINQALAQQIQSILESRTVKPGQYQALNTEAYDQKGNGGTTAGLDNRNDYITGSIGNGEDGTAMGGEAGTNLEEILVPAGTILYGQILNEANSDTPGPIVAQILSGPFTGSRVIGEFQTRNKKNIIEFNTAVINGVGTNMQAVAIDPSTTSPGMATDVDNRYVERILLPAAARFIEGLGQAYSESETQVFTTGDVVVTETDKLKTKQQIARGVERGAQRAGDILEDEGDRLQPLIRVEAGTPVGIMFIQPIVKPRGGAQYNPEGIANNGQ